MRKVFATSLNPNRKICLDIDGENSKTKNLVQSSSFRSFESFVDQELNRLPSDIFFVEKLPIGQKSEIFDEQRETSGCFLNCKLVDITQPSTPALRLKISPNYPYEQPEILSLTKSQPPKLDFTGSNSTRRIVFALIRTTLFSRCSF